MTDRVKGSTSTSSRMTLINIEDDEGTNIPLLPAAVAEEEEEEEESVVARSNFITSGVDIYNNNNNNTMRRGTSALSGNKSPLIAVEYYDMEGGGDSSSRGGYSVSSDKMSSGGRLDIGSIMEGHHPRSSPSSGGSFAHAYHGSTSNSSKSSSVSVQYIAWIVGVLILLLFISPLTWKILGFVYAAIAFGFIGSLWLSKSVLAADDGTPEMQSVGNPIREGAKGFLNVQYTASL
jgi:hypothetical protein